VECADRGCRRSAHMGVCVFGTSGLDRFTRNDRTGRRKRLGYLQGVQRRRRDDLGAGFDSMVLPDRWHLWPGHERARVPVLEASVRTHVR